MLSKLLSKIWIIKGEYMLTDVFHIGRPGVSHCIEEVEDRGPVQILRLRGPVDMYTIPEVETLLWRAREKKGQLQKDIMLDFKHVGHVDSSTCALLVRALNEVKHDHHKLVIVNAPQQLKGILEITHLKKLFTAYDSEEEGLKALQKA